MKTNKKTGVIALALALALILGCTLSLFTDRANLGVTGTSGTVDIILTPDVELTDSNGKDILNPGAARKVNFSIKNSGNKSVDLREFIKLTCSVPMTETNGRCELELYKTTDVEVNSDGLTVPKANAAPLTVRSLSQDGKTITYEIPIVTLDGNHNTPLGNYETEPEANGLDTLDEQYTLIFSKNAGMAFQAATVTIEKMVDAKQHRNTAAAPSSDTMGETTGWETVGLETYTFQNGDMMTPPEIPAPVIPSEHSTLDKALLASAYNANSSVEHIVFGKASDYASVVQGTDGTSVGEFINAYAVSDTLYVLSDSIIDLPEDSSKLFNRYRSVTSIYFDNVDASQVTDMNNMFSYSDRLTSVNIADLDTSGVSAMNYMFANCSALTNFDLRGLDTSSATNMSRMFTNCSSLQTLDISGWDVETVENFDGMFLNCAAVTIDLTGWNPVSATSMRTMFNNASHLVTIYGGDWNSIRYDANMFKGCTSLVGAVYYNSGKVTSAYANTQTGYFTAK